MSGSALQWWRSFLNKEREDAKLQCPDCLDLKQKIVGIKTSSNEEKAENNRRKAEKNKLHGELKAHR